MWGDFNFILLNLRPSTFWFKTLSLSCSLLPFFSSLLSFPVSFFFPFFLHLSFPKPVDSSTIQKEKHQQLPYISQVHLAPPKIWDDLRMQKKQEINYKVCLYKYCFQYFVFPSSLPCLFEAKHYRRRLGLIFSILYYFQFF